MPSAERPVIEAKKPKKVSVCHENITSRLCKHLQKIALLSWRTGFFFYYYFDYYLLFPPGVQQLSRTDEKGGHLENNPTKLHNTTVAVMLQKDTTHYKNCHRHLNLNGSFFLLSVFPGDGSAEHGLDPPGTLLSLSSVVPPRLVSSLLRPPACDLGIDLSSLSSSMSQFLKCIWRSSESGGEERLPQAPQTEMHRCALCCRPLPVLSEVPEE